MQQWRQGFELDGRNLSSWYHYLPIQQRTGFWQTICNLCYMCAYKCALHDVFRFLLDDGALYLSDKVHAKEIDIKKSEISMILIFVCASTTHADV